ncbi:MAG TPA: DUF1326 domain-containing protein [Chloroflexota bacterium]|nr:DUF1326 domain-containing protein [Chloroflexota bacterium]
MELLLIPVSSTYLMLAWTCWIHEGKGAGCNMANVPPWHAAGDWFDACSCNIPCPCEFAQPPTNNICDGVLAYHIREGHYAI